MAIPGLQYMAAGDVAQDSGALGYVVELPDGRPIGRLDGFMVDTEQQRLCYFVVTQTSERSQSLAKVPFVAARLDADQGVIRLLDAVDPQPL